MPVNLGTIYASAGLDISPLKRAHQQARQDYAQFGRQLEQQTQQVTRRVQRSYDNLARSLRRTGQMLSLALTTPITAITGALVKMGSDAEQVYSRFDILFRHNAREARKWVNNFADTVGRSRVEIAELMNSFQDLFVPMGHTRQEAEKLSKSMVALAVDVASFTNRADAEVVRDFSSALVGNHEAVQKYGIVISETRMKQEALNMGFKKAYEELTDLEKMQIRYNIIVNDTADAHGNAVATQDELANQLKTLRGAVRDVADVFARDLMPTATLLVGWATEFVRSLENLSEEQRLAIRWAVMFAAALGPVAMALGVVVKAIGVASGALTLLGGVMAFVTSPVVLAIAGIVFGLATLATAWEKDWGRVRSTSETVRDKVVRAVDGIQGALGSLRLPDPGLSEWEQTWNLIVAALEGSVAKIVGVLTGITWPSLPPVDLSDWQGSWESAKTTAAEKVAGIKQSIKEADWPLLPKVSLHESWDALKDVVSQKLSPVETYLKTWQWPVLAGFQLHASWNKLKETVTEKLTPARTLVDQWEWPVLSGFELHDSWNALKDTVTEKLSPAKSVLEQWKWPVLPKFTLHTDWDLLGSIVEQKLASAKGTLDAFQWPKLPKIELDSSWDSIEEKIAEKLKLVEDFLADLKWPGLPGVDLHASWDELKTVVASKLTPVGDLITQWQWPDLPEVKWHASWETIKDAVAQKLSPAATSIQQWQWPELPVVKLSAGWDSLKTLVEQKITVVSGYLDAVKWPELPDVSLHDGWSSLQTRVADKLAPVVTYLSDLRWPVLPNVELHEEWGQIKNRITQKLEPAASLLTEWKWPSLPVVDLHADWDALKDTVAQKIAPAEAYVKDWKWPQLPEIDLHPSWDALESVVGQKLSPVKSYIENWKWPKLPQIEWHPSWDTLSNAVAQKLSSAKRPFEGWQWPSLPEITLPDSLSGLDEAVSQKLLSVKTHIEQWKGPVLPEIKLHSSWDNIEERLTAKLAPVKEQFDKLKSTVTQSLGDVKTYIEGWQWPPLPEVQLHPSWGTLKDTIEGKLTPASTYLEGWKWPPLPEVKWHDSWDDLGTAITQRLTLAKGSIEGWKWPPLPEVSLHSSWGELQDTITQKLQPINELLKGQEWPPLPEVKLHASWDQLKSQIGQRLTAAGLTVKEFSWPPLPGYSLHESWDSIKDTLSKKLEPAESYLREWDWPTLSAFDWPSLPEFKWPSVPEEDLKQIEKLGEVIEDLTDSLTEFGGIDWETLEIPELRFDRLEVPQSVLVGWDSLTQELSGFSATLAAVKVTDWEALTRGMSEFGAALSEIKAPDWGKILPQSVRDILKFFLEYTPAGQATIQLRDIILDWQKGTITGAEAIAQAIRSAIMVPLAGIGLMMLPGGKWKLALGIGMIALSLVPEHTITGIKQTLLRVWDKIVQTWKRLPGIEREVVTGPYDDIIEATKQKLGSEIPTGILNAIMSVESSFNAAAQKTEDSARGLFQITKEVASQLGVSYEDLFDVETNIEAGIRYLESLLEKYEGDYEKALAAFYLGPDVVPVEGVIPPDLWPKEYIDKVMAEAFRFTPSTINLRDYFKFDFSITEQDLENIGKTVGYHSTRLATTVFNFLITGLSRALNVLVTDPATSIKMFFRGLQLARNVVVPLVRGFFRGFSLAFQEWIRDLPKKIGAEYKKFTDALAQGLRELFGLEKAIPVPEEGESFYVKLQRRLAGYLGAGMRPEEYTPADLEKIVPLRTLADIDEALSKLRMKAPVDEVVELITTLERLRSTKEAVEELGIELQLENTESLREILEDVGDLKSEAQEMGQGFQEASLSFVSAQEEKVTGLDAVIERLRQIEGLLPTLSGEDITLIARMVQAEAEGEPLAGQVGVASVILNRLLSPLHPNTVLGVLTEKTASGAFQFSPMEPGGRFHEIIEPNTRALEAVRQALEGWDPTHGALYFYNPELVSDKSWIRSRQAVVQIGQHVFATNPVEAEFQRGTPWTGWGPTDEIAGVVHRREAVIPWSALRKGIPGVLEFLGVKGFQAGRDFALSAGMAGGTAKLGFDELAKQTQSVTQALSEQEAQIDSLNKSLSDIGRVLLAGLSEIFTVLGQAILGMLQNVLGEEQFAKLSATYEEAKKRLEELRQALIGQQKAQEETQVAVDQTTESLYRLGVDMEAFGEEVREATRITVEAAIEEANQRKEAREREAALSGSIIDMFGERVNNLVNRMVSSIEGDLRLLGIAFRFKEWEDASGTVIRSLAGIDASAMPLVGSFVELGRLFAAGAPKIDEALGTLLSSLSEKIDVKTPIADVIGGITGVVKEAGAGVMGGLRDVGKSIAEDPVGAALISTGQEIGGALGGIVGTIGNVLGAGLPGFEMMAAWLQIINPLGMIMAGIMEELQPIIDGMKEPFLILGHTLAQIFMPLLEGIMPAFEALGVLVGNVLAPLLELLAPPLRMLGNLLANYIITLFRALAPTLRIIFNVIAQLLIPVLQALALPLKAMGWIMEHVVGPVFTFVAKLIADIWNAIANAINAVLGWLGVNLATIDVEVETEKATEGIEPVEVGAGEEEEAETGGTAGAQITRLTGPALDAFKEMLRPLSALSKLPGYFTRMESAIFEMRDAFLTHTLGGVAAAASVTVYSDHHYDNVNFYIDQLATREQIEEILEEFGISADLAAEGAGL